MIFTNCPRLEEIPSYVEMWTQSDNKQFDEREYIEAEADKIIHAEVDDLFRRGDAHGYINEQHQQRRYPDEFSRQNFIHAATLLEMKVGFPGSST